MSMMAERQAVTDHPPIKEAESLSDAHAYSYTPLVGCIIIDLLLDDQLTQPIVLCHHAAHGCYHHDGLINYHQFHPEEIWLVVTI